MRVRSERRCHPQPHYYKGVNEQSGIYQTI
jgi:hypothetical protein